MKTISNICIGYEYKDNIDMTLTVATFCIYFSFLWLLKLENLMQSLVCD